MCEKCVDAMERILPDTLDWEQKMNILWSWTAFPAGSPETIERQLTEHAERLRDVQSD